jgi:hypothetical protein
LEKLIEAEPVKKDFVVYGAEFFGVSSTDFFNNFFGDDAPHCLTFYFAARGDTTNFIEKWRDPQGDECEYKKMPVLSIKKLDVIYTVKSTFVKAAPTLRTFMLLEKSEERIIFRVLNKSRDVPYCDTFGVEEEFYVASPPGAKCCVVRCSHTINWYKSTMMKSIVRSSAESEGKSGVESVFKMFGDTCGPFEEKIKPKRVAKAVLVDGEAKTKEEESEDKEDYTTEAELRALNAHIKLQDGYTEYNANVCLSINVEEYYR